MKRTIVDVSTGEVTSVELKPEEEQEVLDSIASIPSPIRTIDARRLRLALLKIDKLDIVEEAIKSADRAAQVDWEYATFISEDYPLVKYFAESLSLDIKLIFEIALSLA